MKVKEVPENTLERLVIYLKVLENLDTQGIDSISSEELARRCGINSAQLRKDLSFVGTLGTKGVGYNVKSLKFSLKRFLGRSQEWNMVLGGINSFGIFLLENKELQKEGFYFMAAFDTNDSNIGKIYNGVSVYNLDQLSYVVKAIRVDIGVIVAEENPEEYLEAFLNHGIRAILNLSKVPLFPNEKNIKIENFSFSMGLTKLSYFLSK
ncbi:MAG: redox-sensing transcriptional repressor Rex [Thermodesulfobacteria bacterium]|nr:redox-sensing transcriptional repressor Rex [Thermodesulfobacteriota bacterium]